MAFIHKARNPSLWLPGRLPDPNKVRLDTSGFGRNCEMLFLGGSLQNFGLKSVPDLQILNATGSPALVPRPGASALGPCWDFSACISSSQNVNLYTQYKRNGTSDPQPPSIWTMEWYGIPQSNGTTDQSLCGFGDASTGSGFSAWDRDLLLRSDGVVFAYFYDGASEERASPGTVTFGQPLHVVFAMNNGLTANLYVNGALVNSSTNWSSGGYQGYSDCYFLVGGGKTSSRSGQTTAAILSCRFDNRCWTADEIAYRAQNPFCDLIPLG